MKKGSGVCKTSEPEAECGSASIVSQGEIYENG